MKQHKFKLPLLSLTLILMSCFASVARSEDFQAELLHTKGAYATGVYGVHVDRGVEPVVRVAGYEQTNEGGLEQPVLFTKINNNKWTRTFLPTGVYGSGRANHVTKFGSLTYVVGKVGEPSHGAVWVNGVLAYVDASEGSEIKAVSSEIRPFESTYTAGHRVEGGLKKAVSLWLFNGAVLDSLELHNPDAATESWATGVHVNPYGANMPVQFSITARVNDTETAFYTQSNQPQKWQPLDFGLFTPSLAHDVWWYCLANEGFQYDEETGGFWHAYHPILMDFKLGWEYDDLTPTEPAGDSTGVFGGFFQSNFHELVVGTLDDPKYGTKAQGWDVTFERLITPFSLHPYLEVAFGDRFLSSAAHKVYMTDTAANTFWTCVSGVGFEDDGTGPKPRAVAWVRVFK